MSARAFNFKLGKYSCFAQGHPSGWIILFMTAGDGSGTSLDLMARMTPSEARAMAVALEAAATHAENTIADTGLGESAAADLSPMERDAGKLAEIAR